MWKVYILHDSLCKIILDNANKSIVTEIQQLPRDWRGVHGKEGWIKKEQMEILGGDGYIQYFNYGNGFIDLYTVQIWSNCTLWICAIYCMSIISW